MKRIIALVLFLLAAPAYGQEGGSRFISTAAVVQAAAYATGDTIGGLLTFNAVCSAKSLKADLLGVKVFDKAGQTADLDLVLFDTGTITGTFTENAAFDPDDTMLPSISTVIPITTHKTFSDNGIHSAANIVVPIRCTTDHKVYGYLVSRGAPTQASTSDLTVQIEVVPNY